MQVESPSQSAPLCATCNYKVGWQNQIGGGAEFMIALAHIDSRTVKQDNDPQDYFVVPNRYDYAIVKINKVDSGTEEFIGSFNLNRAIEWSIVSGFITGALIFIIKKRRTN